ncbi:phage capsid protein [Roseococcus thiosulfatophilus]|uniref:phage capsid protein n=1 Tax=Roseococcus thiosulfatophilus TaxID=35813 RepID=UPI001A9027BD|nr:phage capsid protein [Roseococcus thiosulfatophilus]
MAIYVSKVFQQSFDAQVKAAYEMGGKLRARIRVATNVVGTTHDFRRVGKGVAVPHRPVQPRTPIGIDFNKATATLSAWEATEYVDVRDMERVNFEERGLLAQAIGHSITRREDQLIIDAMAAAFSGATIAVGAAGLTDAKLRQAARIFEDRAIPRENRTILMGAEQYDNVMGEGRHSSRDFGDGSVTQTGELRPLYGFTPIIMESRDEGGLPKVSNDRQVFCFDRQAVGLAIGGEDPTAIDWLPQLKAWQINKGIHEGAVVIDPLGVIRIDCLEG